MNLNLDIPHRDYLKLSVVLGLGYLALGHLLTFLKIQPINVTLSMVGDVNVRQQIMSNFQGITQGVAAKLPANILAAITGYLPQGFWSQLVYCLVGSLLVVYTGGLLLHIFGLGENLTETARLVALLITGSAIWGGLLGWWAFPSTVEGAKLLISPILAVSISSAILVLWVKLWERVGIIDVPEIS